MTKSNGGDLAVVDEMTANIMATFSKILANNNWLTNAGKLTAQKKLSAMKTFIGYPSWLWSTREIKSGFQGIQEGSNSIETYGNVVRWASSNKILQGNRPSKPEEPWFAAEEPATNDLNLVLPSSVQGYYVPSLNSVVLPMGLIQPHLFYNNVPSCINYGRIGAVIGHEISHGFHADQMNLDANGNFNGQSWTVEDKQNYEEKSNCYRDQYNKFEVLPGIFVNGSSCLNENIVDNNGMKIAYLTYKDHYAHVGNDEQCLPGFEKLSVEQLFFLSYGSLRCEHADEATQQQNVQEDPHNPGKYRTNGVLQNSPEFADAWNCPVGSPMNPIRKCMLW